MPSSEKQKYTPLRQLAKDLSGVTGGSVDYDQVYAFIRRWNRKDSSKKIRTFTSPLTGRTIYLLTDDAEMIKAIFTNPDDYIEERRSKKS